MAYSCVLTLKTQGENLPRGQPAILATRRRARGMRWRKSGQRRVDDSVLADAAANSDLAFWTGRVPEPGCAIREGCEFHVGIPAKTLALCGLVAVLSLTLVAGLGARAGLRFDAALGRRARIAGRHCRHDGAEHDSRALTQRPARLCLVGDPHRLDPEAQGLRALRGGPPHRARHGQGPFRRSRGRGPSQDYAKAARRASNGLARSALG